MASKINPQLDLDHGGHIDPSRPEAGFSPDFFAELFQQECGNYWFRSRNRLLIQTLQRFFPHAHSLLEIGCGTGFVLLGFHQAFPHLQLYGSELFNEGLVFANQRLPGITLLQMDARCISYEMEFDVIGAFDVLEHIQEDEGVLSQMFHAVKPGGGILITVPQHRFLWSVVDEHAFHKRRYSRRELVAKVERAGFRVIRTTSFVSLLLPLLVLSRLKRHITRANFNPLAEYNISKTLKDWLEKVLNFERAAIDRGISFPAGGSLLLIAIREPR
jgi:SAM-dependent methyltransferase